MLFLLFITYYFILFIYSIIIIMSDSSNSNPSAAGDPSGAPSNPIVLESDSAGDNTTSTEGAEEDKKLSPADDLFIQNEATTEDIVFLP